MLDLESICRILKQELDEKRFRHSIGVKEKAEELAKLYNISVEKARIAGLVHDCAKNYNSNQLLTFACKLNIVLDDVTKQQEHLLHGKIGARIARDRFNIEDNDILNAIKYHTTGRQNMSKLEKIIYLSDFIEPNRSFPGINSLRNEALFDLDKATLMALNHTITYVISKGQLLHPDTIYARNYLLLHI